LNNNRGNNRRRGRGNNRQQGGGQQLNRIDSRARGNAPQLLEKYRKAAHDAHLNGDRVNEEYYLQFADHYFRVIADQRQRQEEQRNRPRDDRWQEGGEGEREESEYGSDYGMDGDYTAYDQPHRRDERPSRYEDRQPRYEDREERPARYEAREERAPTPRTPEPHNDQPRTDEPAAETGAEEAASSRSVYEPAENPFVRENRASRGLRPRREDRRPRREPRDAEQQAEASGDGEASVALDPAILPPSISTGREEGADAPVEAGDSKPRRRTRRPRPPADDAGETLQAVN
jgi:hypothetical protein